GRFGLRLAEPGTGKRVSALAYGELGENELEAQAREERRLFYVAMTRAKERLILSGAARLESWPAEGSGGPISWIAPALLGGGASSARAASGLSAVERGVLIHALLERLDFRRPSAPSAVAIVEAAAMARVARPGAEEIAELAQVVQAFGASEICTRLARATQV